MQASSRGHSQVLFQMQFGKLIVMGRGAISNVATAGMQQAPDLFGISIVVDNFQKVIATPESTELVRDTGQSQLFFQVVGGFHGGRDLVQDALGALERRPMLAKACRDSFFEFLLNGILVRIRQVASKQIVDWNGSHAAADIDPDCHGTNILGTGKDRSNRNTFLR